MVQILVHNRRLRDLQDQIEPWRSNIMAENLYSIVLVSPNYFLMSV